ncbi:MAG: DNA recombination protein RmuC, partial [Acidobacteria bacterium]|nr:DNA recombination protein RmuC [Acidobacteriota bacterium]
MEWALLAVGLVLGGIAGWLWASSHAAQRGTAAQLDAEGRIRAAESSAQELRTQVTGLQKTSAELQEKIRTESELKSAAEARLKEAHANLEEQKKMLDEARQKLADTFSALASEALKSNNQAFIALARSTFETIQAQAKGELETRQKAVEGLVSPLRESLERYEKQ